MRSIVKLPIDPLDPRMNDGKGYFFNVTIQDNAALLSVGLDEAGVPSLWFEADCGVMPMPRPFYVNFGEGGVPDSVLTEHVGSVTVPSKPKARGFTAHVYRVYADHA